MGNELHSDGRPIIKNYEDAFRYIVKDQVYVRSEQAIAFLMFSADLRKSIEQRESSSGQRVSRDETDQHISQWICTRELDEYAKRALIHIEGIIEEARIKERDILRRAPLKRLIQDIFFKTMASAIFMLIGAIFTISFAVYSTRAADERGFIASISGYIDRCIASDSSE